MTNGFYDLKHLDTKTKLKKFYTRAVMLSYNVMIHYLSGIQRQMDTSMNIEDILKIVDTKTHNVCIDRNLYNRGAISSRDAYEVGFSTMHGESKFLFCFMNDTNFDKLIKEFDLKLKQW